MMLDHGIEHSKIIFGKEYKPSQREVVKALYKEIVKGKDTEYPLRLQPKITKARDSDDYSKVLENIPNVSVYMEGSVEPTEIESFEQLEKLVPKNGFVKAIIQPKTWYIAGKFGLSLTLVQLLVRKRIGGRPTGYAFSVKNSSDNNSKNDDEQNDEQDDEQDEEQVDTDVDEEGEEVSE